MSYTPLPAGTEEIQGEGPKGQVSAAPGDPDAQAQVSSKAAKDDRERKAIQEHAAQKDADEVGRTMDYLAYRRIVLDYVSQSPDLETA